jgi:hypothetical protein
MPWAFRQRIGIRKRKLTTGRSTLMRHSLSYRDWLKSSNAEVATPATSLSTVRSRLARRGCVQNQTGKFLETAE